MTARDAVARRGAASGAGAGPLVHRGGREPGAARSAVLSHGLWMRRYGAMRAIIGRSVILGGVPDGSRRRHARLVCVPDPRVEAWIVRARLARRRVRPVATRASARLRDGVTLRDARAELNGLIADVPQAFPGDPRALGQLSNQTVLQREDPEGRR